MADQKRLRETLATLHTSFCPRRGRCGCVDRAADVVCDGGSLFDGPVAISLAMQYTDV